MEKWKPIIPLCCIFHGENKFKIWIKSSPKHNFVGFTFEATDDLLVHENKCTKQKQYEISEITQLRIWNTKLNWVMFVAKSPNHDDQKL